LTAWAAWRDGVRRVNGAPLVLVGMFLLTLLVALPLSIALRGMIAQHLDDSLVADTLATGTNLEWWEEFSAQATGLGTTFVPSIIGFGAVLENLGGFLDSLPMAATIGGATSAWLVVWSFLSGGVLDRYARQRPTRAYGFFAACGTHFWRFVRLGVFAWTIYWVLFAQVHVWLFDLVYPWATRNVTAERTAFAIRVLFYLGFGVLLIICNIVFDYARIRIVVEDRHSAIGAILAGARFVRRHPTTLKLYALNGAVFLALALAYALLSPGAPAGLAFWIAFVIGQIYILARHYSKLLFYASQVAFFQSALAHASYTAAPAVEWPDSPAAESIGNANSVS
jgi:hypothetical protein